MACLALTIRSSSSHYSSVELSWPRNQLKDVFFLFAFKVSLVEYTSMLCMSIIPWTTSRVPDKIAWCCSDRRSYSIYPSPGVNTDFAIGKSPPLSHHNRYSSRLYDWCDTGGCSFFTKSSQNIDLPIWSKDFKLWFVSPDDFILLLYCPVFVCLGPLEPFNIILLPQQWFLDSNSAI